MNETLYVWCVRIMCPFNESNFLSRNKHSQELSEQGSKANKVTCD